MTASSAGDPTDGRKRKLAQNQALFREVNDRIHELAGKSLRGSRTNLDVVCECSDAACAELMSVPFAVYEQTRQHGARFLTMHGHELVELERVTAVADAYPVVEKFGQAALAVVRAREVEEEVREAVGDAAAAGVSKPMLLFFYSSREGRSRRVEGFLAQVLQRRRNHESFVIKRIDIGERPELAERFRVAAPPALIVVAERRVRAKLESPRAARTSSRRFSRGFGNQPSPIACTAG